MGRFRLAALLGGACASLVAAGAIGAASMASGAVAPKGASVTTAVPAAATVSGNWGSVRDIPGLAALSGGRDAVASTVTCATPGNCTVGGYFTDANTFRRAFVAVEKNGTWGNAIPVPGIRSDLGTPESVVTAVSCATAVDCAAAGTTFVKTDRAIVTDVFVVEERNGTWGTATIPPGSRGPGAGNFDFAPTTIACAPASPGDCVVGGTFTDGSNLHQVFVMDETNGTWGNLTQIPGTAAINTRGSVVTVTSLACGGPSRCVVGANLDSASLGPVGFVAEENAGTWREPGVITRADFTPTGVSSVSCADAGDCAVTGTFIDAASRAGLGWVETERNGVWGLIAIPGLADLNVPFMGDGVPASVSCALASPGNCVIAGTYANSVGDNHPFIAEESNGTWGNATPLPISATIGSGDGESQWKVNSDSCGSTGNCAITGSYQAGNAFHAWVADERGGTWGDAGNVPGSTQIAPLATPRPVLVACASADDCALAGTVIDPQLGLHAFVADESSAVSVSLAVAKATVAFGQEQAGHLTIAVTPRTGGTPAGAVTIKAGSAKLATVSLNAAGGATWTLPAKVLKVGTYPLTASYASSNGYDSATSTAVKLIVAKPVSVVALTLATAKVRVGHEQSARLAIKVTSPAGGIPAGKVTIKAGATALATVALSKSGTATWVMPASRLRPGTYQLTVSYASSNGYQPATSVKRQLVVTK